MNLTNFFVLGKWEGFSPSLSTNWNIGNYPFAPIRPASSFLSIGTLVKTSQLLRSIKTLILRPNFRLFVDSSKQTNISILHPLDTGRKLNVHMTFKRHSWTSERLTYVQVTFCVHLASYLVIPIHPQLEHSKKPRKFFFHVIFRVSLLHFCG